MKNGWFVWFSAAKLAGAVLFLILLGSFEIGRQMGEKAGYATGLKEGRAAPIEDLAEEAAEKAYEGLSKKLVRVFDDLNRAEGQVLIHLEITKKVRAEREALEKALLENTSGPTRNQVQKIIGKVPKS